jgi:hypothetical protein
MSFSGDIAHFTRKVETEANDRFVRIVTETTRSIVEGSEITGSPGQPVGQYGPGYHQGYVGGTLKASWHTVFESPRSALIASGGLAAAYNRAIEDGVGKFGPLTLRSTVGGFHSLKLTIAGFPRIVAAVAK